jgi:hypothetical protein
MPRKPIDYSKTHFYKLCCKDLEIKAIYVGHTTDFRKRKNQHKRDCEDETRKMHNCPVYQFIRANNGWGNWDMILIDTKACNDSQDARRVEREYIESLCAELNKAIPTRTKAEYYEANKDTILTQKKEYYANNKEHIHEKKQGYNLKHKEHISNHKKEYYQANAEQIKEKRKQYRETHKDMIKDKKKAYAESHKAQIRERDGKQCICSVCGGTYTHQHQARHNRSIKHQKAWEARSDILEI